MKYDTDCVSDVLILQRDASHKRQEPVQFPNTSFQMQISNFNFPFFQPSLIRAQAPFQLSISRLCTLSAGPEPGRERVEGLFSISRFLTF